MDVMLLAGTRSEAVRLAPLAVALNGHGVLRPLVLHSGRHDGAIEQALAPFGLFVDAWLEIEAHAESRPAELVARLLPALDDTFRRHRPAALVVPGETPTVLAGALAAFWSGIPVVHLEAGSPTPEMFADESTRHMVSRIAALHLATTSDAAASLRAEGVPRQRISIVGNTAVDAAKHIAARDLPARCAELALLEMEVNEAGQRLVLVAANRYQGEPLNRVLSAVRRLVEEQADLQVLLPVPREPAVRDQALGMLGDLARVTMTEPLDYPDLIRALRVAALVLTDSADLRHEAPAFGTPVLVLDEPIPPRPARDDTAAAGARPVGTDPAAIYSAATQILGGRRSAPSGAPSHGDGGAAARVVIALEDLLGIAEGHFSARV